MNTSLRQALTPLSPGRYTGPITRRVYTGGHILAFFNPMIRPAKKVGLFSGFTKDTKKIMLGPLYHRSVAFRDNGSLYPHNVFSWSWLLNRHLSKKQYSNVYPLWAHTFLSSPSGYRTRVNRMIIFFLLFEILTSRPPAPLNNYYVDALAQKMTFIATTFTGAQTPPAMLTRPDNAEDFFSAIPTLQLYSIGVKLQQLTSSLPPTPPTTRNGSFFSREHKIYNDALKKFEQAYDDILHTLLYNFYRTTATDKIRANFQNSRLQNKQLQESLRRTFADRTTYTQFSQYIPITAASFAPETAVPTIKDAILPVTQNITPLSYAEQLMLDAVNIALQRAQYERMLYFVNEGQSHVPTGGARSYRYIFKENPQLFKDLTEGLTRVEATRFIYGKLRELSQSSPVPNPMLSPDVRKAIEIGLPVPLLTLDATSVLLGTQSVIASSLPPLADNLNPTAPLNVTTSAELLVPQDLLMSGYPVRQDVPESKKLCSVLLMMDLALSQTIAEVMRVAPNLFPVVPTAATNNVLKQQQPQLYVPATDLTQEQQQLQLQLQLQQQQQQQQMYDPQQMSQYTFNTQPALVGGEIPQTIPIQPAPYPGLDNQYPYTHNRREVEQKPMKTVG
eukprot:UN02681